MVKKCLLDALSPRALSSATSTGWWHARTHVASPQAPWKHEMSELGS